MAVCDWSCSHMGLKHIHKADLECEGSYQSLYSQNRRSSCCPVAGLWRPGPLGQQRPQGETNTQRLSLLLPPSLSFPFLRPAHSLCLSEAHCLSALSSVHLHNSSVQWPLTDPTWVTCLFTHGEGGHHLSFWVELLVCKAGLLRGWHVNQTNLGSSRPVIHIVLQTQDRYCHHYNISLVPFPSCSSRT